MVADEHGLALGSALEDAGALGTSLPQQQGVRTAEDGLEERLAALRK